jgi:phenylalanyl-tRNA synthetase alpha chain
MLSNPKALKELQKRKLVGMQKVISFKFSKGPKYAREFKKDETDLTADMIAS